MEIKPIADYRGDFPDKFGIPRQSLVVPEIEGLVVFRPEFRIPEAVRGLEGFDFCWLIWGFSMNEGEWSPTVRPPRLGGNERVGVFASRSPFRPNSLGLSCVRIVGIEDGPAIRVKGADLADGTPIYDIKPYVPFTDAHSDAKAGFTDSKGWKRLEVVFDDGVDLDGIDRDVLAAILAEDPRPHYQDSPDRVYGMSFAGRQIKFTVTGTLLRVISVLK